MAETRRVKTETLSLRLDPKIKFMLALLSRLKGQSLTSVVEHSIREAANSARVGPRYDDRGNELPMKNWSRYWDPSEGVRTLNLLADADYPTTFDEDQLRNFTLEHWQFFYNQRDGEAPRRAYVDILWGRIEDFLKLWNDTKDTNYWAAGEAMLEALRAVRVATPVWPPRGEARAKRPAVVDELDDDIPF